ncbi:MAG: ThiF family adenylyltransferase [Pseudobdellovibrio sp.]
MENYDEFTNRNQIYIKTDEQTKISKLRILIAGCGVGSQVAMALTQLGFQNFTVIDGDTISLSNLNRQAFRHHQIGKNKATCLRDNILEINPEANVVAIAENLGPDKLYLLDQVDFIIDTIDFLDLKSILLLHETAEVKKIPLVSGLTVGWGACAIFFPNTNAPEKLFRKIFNVADSETDSPMSYVDKFQKLFYSLSGHIDEQVVKVMDKTFQSMLDNKPCPAPQVAAGTYCIASLVTTILAKYIRGDIIPKAPELMIIDMFNLINKNSFNLFDIKKL